MFLKTKLEKNTYTYRNELKNYFVFVTNCILYIMWKRKQIKCEKKPIVDAKRQYLGKCYFFVRSKLI